MEMVYLYLKKNVYISLYNITRYPHPSLKNQQQKPLNKKCTFPKRKRGRCPKHKSLHYQPKIRREIPEIHLNFDPSQNGSHLNHQKMRHFSKQGALQSYSIINFHQVIR